MHESYPIEALLVVAFISFSIGFVSHFMLSKHEVSLEKRVAMLILLCWMSFAMVAFLLDRDLSIFFNSAGLGAVGNLLGIKTSEWFSSFIRK